MNNNSDKETITNFNSVMGSEDKTEFETGAHRDRRVGKGRFDLIPPTAMRRLARHYENGAKKYGARNWENGIPLHCYIDSAITHIYKWIENKLLNRQQEEDHLSATVWNIMCAIHTEEMITKNKLPNELDDIVNRLK